MASKKKKIINRSKTSRNPKPEIATANPVKPEMRMNIQVKESFSYWATNPNDMTTSDMSPIKDALNEYPYCQILHFLNARVTAKWQPDDYTETLKLSSSYILSRNALRKMVQGEMDWNDHILASGIPALPKEIIPTNTHKVELPDLSKLSFDFESLAKKAKLPDIPPIDETTRLETNLQQELSDLQKTEALEARLEQERQDQFDIIDSYIENEALLGPIRVNINDRSEPEDLAKKRGLNNDMGNIVSEGMAKLMLRQGKIEKAIDIYEQLILKKPEKKAYFAEKIKELMGE